VVEALEAFVGAASGGGGGGGGGGGRRRMDPRLLERAHRARTVLRLAQAQAQAQACK
jgi:hypothetical protein